MCHVNHTSIPEDLKLKHNISTASPYNRVIVKHALK